MRQTHPLKTKPTPLGFCPQPGKSKVWLIAVSWRPSFSEDKTCVGQTCIQQIKFNFVFFPSKLADTINHTFLMFKSL